MDKPDFNNLPYAGFLEEFVRELVDLDPVSIGVCAILSDGRVLTGYHDASPQDKAMFAYHMRSDAMFDELENNAEWLRSIINGDDEPMDEEEEQEDE